MKILKIESSPHQHGSSNLLAGEFIWEAQEVYLLGKQIGG